jgi:hypothetical protein
MAIIDSMRGTLRRVPGLLGETWTWRVRTSAPGVEPITFSATSSLPALFTGMHIGLEDDPKTNSRKRMARARLRVSDLVVIPFGAEAIEPDGTVWSVGGQVGDGPVESSGIGTIAYHLQRELTSAVGMNRGGGV